MSSQNSQSSRCLVVMRHAHAEPASAPGTDEQRPVTPQGRDAAAAAGARLSAAGLSPDYVLCSTARRARETWTMVQPALSTEPVVELDRRLYGAGLDETLALVSETPATVSTLLVIGHNPTMAHLAGAFPHVGGNGGVDSDFAPASLAVIDLDVTWLYTAPGAGTARRL
ncbi:histidine phosphatase family protein [Lipingzhangella sp. LS1_29]|uniref:Histidine phosphatase family protein n=1 Tax=Lipingzhangella rawalii TaxID=2055835 RepID=A0ABU2H5B1_9ACTN|nr:histidine phosphatase family protein [Lipingzhangella rawalii]MDS1270030.1 histidine phosphatase family protein [Lipingzhangella rawalii]